MTSSIRDRLRLTGYSEPLVGDMIHFEGQRSFSRSLDEVSASLSDASFLVRCLNDVDVKSADKQRAVWKMRPGFSFIRTTLETTLDVIEHVAGQATKVRMTSTGIGASSTVEVSLTYAPAEQGTTIKWSADVTQLTGLLKLVPRGLIQSAAAKVVEETWTGVERQFSEAK